MKVISDTNYEMILLEGRVDQQTSEELDLILEDCIKRDKIKICIDMINVKHICSSALGVLVAVKRKIIDKEGDIKLVINNENLLKIFQTTMLDKVFEIYESTRECINTFV